MNDVVTARQDRLTAAGRTLPIPMIAALTGAGPLVAVMLDYPFSGAIAVSHTAFHEGVLAPLIRP